jgi:hypothetical protein
MWRTDEIPLAETATGGGAPASWARILLATGVALLVLDARHRRRPGAPADADGAACTPSRNAGGDDVHHPEPGEWDHVSLR